MWVREIRQAIMEAVNKSHGNWAGRGRKAGIVGLVVDGRHVEVRAFWNERNFNGFGPQETPVIRYKLDGWRVSRLELYRLFHVD